MKDIGITNFLVEHASKKPVSFHMPGHKGAKFYKRNGCGKFMRNIADYDITEIPGADNLFQTEGIIEETADKYADLYDVEKSYLLINGTSSGLIASILATVPKGGKLIMARNCHKSVFNALTLGDIAPVYAYPDVIFQYGISGALSPERSKCFCTIIPMHLLLSFQVPTITAFAAISKPLRRSFINTAKSSSSIRRMEPI